MRPEEAIETIFKIGLRDWNYSRKVVKAFLKRAHISSFSSLKFNEHPITALAQEDVTDSRWLNALISINLSELTPGFELPRSWYLRVIPINDWFCIDTNMDFNLLTQLYHRSHVGERGDISPAFLVGSALSARLEIMLCAHYMSEFRTSPTMARIIQLKFAHLLERRNRSQADIEAFKQSVFGEGRSLKEIINSGERTFAEFLELLSGAEKFRAWLKDASPDSHLISEYLRAVTSSTWMEKLPTKAYRFAFFTGAGLLADIVLPTGFGTAAGVSIGAADSLLIDKLIKGWKPNQFIDGPMRKFFATR